jgi:general stress protein 26
MSQTTVRKASRTAELESINPDHATLNDAKRLAELIESVRYAMFTSRSADGELHARPLTTLKIDQGAQLTLSFLVPAEGDIAREVQADPEVNVSYSSPSKDIYASIAATAHLDDDVVRKRELWNAMVQAWFPGGPDDPASVLVVAELHGAEYWHVEQGKIAQTFQMLKAAARGKQPELDAEHRKVAAQ